MEFEPMNHGSVLEAPNDDVRLEPHKCLLARSNILSWLWDCDDGNLVIVASKEGLCPWNDMPDHDSWP